MSSLGAAEELSLFTTLSGADECELGGGAAFVAVQITRSSAQQKVRSRRYLPILSPRMNVTRRDGRKNRRDRDSYTPQLLGYYPLAAAGNGRASPAKGRETRLRTRFYFLTAVGKYAITRVRWKEALYA